MAIQSSDKIERQLANLADSWRRYHGKTEAEIAELVEINRARLIAAAEFSGPLRRSQWAGRIPINPASTMTHQLQGTGRGF